MKLYHEMDILDEALFYLGKSHLKLGERDAARRVFTDLVQNYHDSKFSDKAKKALREMVEQGRESGEK